MKPENKAKGKAKVKKPSNKMVAESEESAASDGSEDDSDVNDDN